MAVTAKKKVERPARIEIVYKDVEALIPYARNSRTHSDGQVAQIAASIKAFGFTNPVLLDGENGVIAGHGRILAARKLKLTELPCIELGYLSENDKRALVIADNKLALNSGWDEEMLIMELGDLASEGFNLEITGFEASEMSKMLGGGGEGPSDLLDPTDGQGQTRGDGTIVIQWGAAKVPLSDEEMAWLDTKLKAHVDTIGTAYGFVREALAGGDLRS